MHQIVMWLGSITAAMGAIIFILIMIMVGTATQAGGAAALLTAAGIGGGLIVSGALLYTFGSIAESLIAIRQNTERQLAIFDRLGKGKAS
ncbi:hypothetical protein AB4144_08715 [Rhizobiaceae sp. 2RAB30]